MPQQSARGRGSPAVRRRRPEAGEIDRFDLGKIEVLGGVVDVEADDEALGIEVDDEARGYFSRLDAGSAAELDVEAVG